LNFSGNNINNKDFWKVFETQIEANQRKRLNGTHLQTIPKYLRISRIDSNFEQFSK